MLSSSLSFQKAWEKLNIQTKFSFFFLRVFWLSVILTFRYFCGVWQLDICLKRKKQKKKEEEEELNNEVLFKNVKSRYKMCMFC